MSKKHERNLRFLARAEASYDWCVKCEAVVPLGHANDTPDEVWMEIRAAAISGPRHLTQAERQGWLAHQYDTDFPPCPNPGNGAGWLRNQHVGWLARAISMHGLEERAPDAAPLPVARLVQR